jgi:RTX toxin RtxA
LYIVPAKLAFKIPWGNIQTRLLGGANVIVKVGDGNISALLFGLANIVTHVNLEGSGNTMSLVVGRANIITRISSLEDYTVNNVGLTNGCCDEIT